MKVKVLEVDQWTSTGNVERFSFKDFDPREVGGGDSDAIRLIFVVKAQVKEVDENDEPPLARVWYREGAEGKLERWKARCDSSG